MITKEEILSFLRQPDQFSKGEFTSAELAKTLGYVKNHTNLLIRRMFDEGLVESVGFRKVQRIDGQKNPVPVYRFTEAFYKKSKDEKRKKK